MGPVSTFVISFRFGFGTEYGDMAPVSTFVVSWMAEMGVVDYRFPVLCYYWVRTAVLGTECYFFNTSVQYSALFWPASTAIVVP